MHKDAISKLISSIDWSKCSKPRCICSAELIILSALDCYEKSAVICDLCGIWVNDSSKVYHCKKGRIEAHKFGFDLCANCAPPSSKEMFIQRISNLQARPKNDICFCGKKMNKIVWQKLNLAKQYCKGCCKVYSLGTTDFYACAYGKNCMYQKISGNRYLICRECLNAKNNRLDDSNGHQLFFDKTMDNINKLS